MKAITILPGTRFGLLVSTGERRHETLKSGGKRFLWAFQCDCGSPVKFLPMHRIRSSSEPSCGCRHYRTITTHGGYRTTLYKMWRGMRERCSNPKNISYKNYGAKGVTVCDEWQDFATFREWAESHGYAPRLTIERHNGKGNYEPGNCSWETFAVQRRNVSNNINITAFGETKCVTDWAADPRCSIKKGALAMRIRKGWDAERAITDPKKDGGRPKGVRDSRPRVYAKKEA